MLTRSHRRSSWWEIARTERPLITMGERHLRTEAALALGIVALGLATLGAGAWSMLAVHRAERWPLAVPT